MVSIISSMLRRDIYWKYIIHFTVETYKILVVLGSLAGYGQQQQQCGGFAKQGTRGPNSTTPLHFPFLWPGKGKVLNQEEAELCWKAATR